jgi:chromosome segregation ATPase
MKSPTPAKTLRAAQVAAGESAAALAAAGKQLAAARARARKAKAGFKRAKKAMKHARAAVKTLKKRIAPLVVAATKAERRVAKLQKKAGRRRPSVSAKRKARPVAKARTARRKRRVLRRSPSVAVTQARVTETAAAPAQQPPPIVGAAS